MFFKLRTFIDVYYVPTVKYFVSVIGLYDILWANGNQLQISVYL